MNIMQTYVQIENHNLFPFLTYGIRVPVTIYLRIFTSVKAELEYQKSRYQVKRSQSAELVEILVQKYSG